MKSIMQNSRLGHKGASLFYSLLCAAFLSGSCGSKDTSTPYHDFRLALEANSCERQFRCCGTQCQAGGMADAGFNSDIKDDVFAINHGLLIFHEDKSKGCLDAINKAFSDCEAPFSSFDDKPIDLACDGILEGTLGVGASCSLTNDYCQPGAFCATDTSVNPPQDRCKQQVSLGGTCDGSVPCVRKSHCDLADTQKCVADTQPAGAGEGCSMTTPCAGNLTCLPTNVCGTAQDTGAACANNTQCLSERCAISSCAAPMTKPKQIRNLVCP